MTRIVTATTTEIRDRECVLKRVTVNTAVANAVVTVHDNTAEGVLAADPNGISLSQTPAAGPNEALTITGALATASVATLGYNRKVTIDAAGDESGRTFTVTGTDENGTAQTEAITGPNATSVAGTKDFLTVTGVSVDANTAGAVTVGAGLATDSIQAVITMPGTLLQNHFTLDYDVVFRFGCTVVTSSTADVTVSVV